ncbi:MAG: hypothetical protein K0R31_446 [Clostridiales bacterium]|jgi:tripartite-type tricarboxylate transporter receptor subunit TctC|nr:hypothetical protein [Clostridiales bacterium]
MKKAFLKIVAVSVMSALLLTTAGCSSSKTSSSNPGTASASTAKATEAPKKIDFPTKAITNAQGWAAGGGADGMYQLVKPYLEKLLKQNFLATYKPGADGAIVYKELAEMKGAKADGYTIGSLISPKMQLNSFNNENAGYKSADFVGVANIFFDPGVLVVPTNSPYKSYKDVMDFAKANPGKLKLAHSGDGGDDWYNALMIQKLTGTKFNLVPFAGDGPAWQAAAGGNVDANMNNLGIVSAQVKGGKLRLLAIYAEKRHPDFPDVPTLKELGVDFSEGSYRGFTVPKDTPKEIVKILADAFEQVTKDPEFIKKAKESNLDIMFLRDKPLQDFIEKLTKNSEAIIKEVKAAK